MNLVKREYLSYDDVLLVPQYSEISSRSTVDLTTHVGTMELKVPIISANMDTVTGPEMVLAMKKCGADGYLHRFQTKETILKWLGELAGVLFRQNGDQVTPSIGINPDFVYLRVLRDFSTSICIDIAHGDSKAMIDTIRTCKEFGFINIIAGNVATYHGAARLIEAGANIIKVGIGPGSVCTTRIVTGHGVPQLTAVDEVARLKDKYDFSIIADGGIKNSGDIVKALAVGADAVMIGKLFAGCDEAPQIHKVPNSPQRMYRGMASKEAQMSFKGQVSNDHPEGAHTLVDSTGPVSEVVKELVGGIRSGLSYSGAADLKSFREIAEFVKVSTLGHKENGAHGLT